MINKHQKISKFNMGTNIININYLIKNNHFSKINIIAMMSNYYMGADIINISFHLSNTHYYIGMWFQINDYCYLNMLNKLYQQSNLGMDINIEYIIMIEDNNHHCICMWFRLKYGVDQHKSSKYLNLFNSFSKETNIININLKINSNHYYNCKNFHSMNY